MLQFISKIFGGSKSEKDVKKIAHLVPIINGHFVSYQELSNDALRGKTTELKARITAHLAAIDQTIKEEQANAEALPMSEFMGRDTIYQNIDELKKERNKALETILMDLLPEAFAVVKEVARRFTNNTELSLIYDSLSEHGLFMDNKMRRIWPIDINEYNLSFTSKEKRLDSSSIKEVNNKNFKQDSRFSNINFRDIFNKILGF